MSTVNKRLRDAALSTVIEHLNRPGRVQPIENLKTVVQLTHAHEPLYRQRTDRDRRRHGYAANVFSPGD